MAHVAVLGIHGCERGSHVDARGVRHAKHAGDPIGELHFELFELRLLVLAKVPVRDLTHFARFLREVHAGIGKRACHWGINLAEHLLEIREAFGPERWLPHELGAGRLLLCFARTGFLTAVRTEHREAMPHDVPHVDMEAIAHADSPRECDEQVFGDFLHVPFPDSFERAHGEPFLVHQEVREGILPVVRQAINVTNALLELGERLVAREAHNRACPCRHRCSRPDRHTA